ncbi:MAG: hypothetical protein SD837_13380 [Candidatus Electrothrix scaldis]|nr:MAG: hypothetical protein SD837_13380 [Candidatus Electrothrix sp. GW3-3]
MTCKDKFVYQGTYTVTAVNLLLAEKEQADEAGEQKAESTDSSLPGNGQGALITTPKEEDDTTDFDFSSILGL